jgi:hypothetical protein
LESGTVIGEGRKGDVKDSITVPQSHLEEDERKNRALGFAYRYFREQQQGVRHVHPFKEVLRVIEAAVSDPPGEKAT